VADICLSMTADDCLTLPDLIENHIPISLPAANWRDYRELEREFLLSTEDGTDPAGCCRVQRRSVDRAVAR